MELLNTNTESSFLSGITYEQETNDVIQFKPAIKTKELQSDYDERERYYKESIIVNYQRYKALFRLNLIGNILIDDKNIIRDLNSKAKEYFSQLSEQGVRIGSSIADWFDISQNNHIISKALQEGLNEVVEIELVGLGGVKHFFQIEIQLFISPHEQRLLKCISFVKVAK